MLVWMSIVVVADLILAIYKTIYLLRQGRASPVPEVSEPQAASAV